MKLAKGAIIGLEVHNKLLRVRWQAVANNALWNKALNAAPNTVMLLSYPITGSAKSACCTLLNVQQLVAAGAQWQPWWMKCHIPAPALSDLPCFLIHWLQEGMSEWVVAYKQVAPCEVVTVNSIEVQASSVLTISENQDLNDEFCDRRAKMTINLIIWDQGCCKSTCIACCKGHHQCTTGPIHHLLTQCCLGAI